MSELWRLSATELAHLVRTRKASAREAAEAALQRLDAINPKVNAVVDHHPDQGPYTPWQMVAWGAVGVLGAAVAAGVRPRELPRWVLVLFCGAAGLTNGVVFSTATGKYQHNLTSGVNTPYTGGTDAGGNQ